MANQRPQRTRSPLTPEQERALDDVDALREEWVAAHERFLRALIVTVDEQAVPIAAIARRFGRKRSVIYSWRDAGYRLPPTDTA